MELLNFKNLLHDIGIMEELRTRNLDIQGRIICGACQAAIMQIQRNVVSVGKVGTTICALYISLKTWTVNDFCQQLVRINKVQNIIC